MPRTPPLSLALLLSLLALSACNETTTPTQPTATADQSPDAPSLALASNSWVMKAPLPAAPPRESWPPFGRGGLAAGVANNAAGQPILYVFSGLSDDNELSWGSHAYNLATNTWTSFGGVGNPFSNGVARIGNKLYISGGYRDLYPVYDPSYVLPELWVYDPLTNRSTRKANMPRATADGISGVIDGRLYVLAGRCVSLGEFVDCHSFYRYNPATNSWTKLAPSPYNHRGGAGGVINGKFYVAGGANGTRLINKLDVYDPATNTWRTRAPLPEVRGGVAGAVLQNKLYVIGGAGPSGDRAVFAYNPVTNTWNTRASLNAGRDNLAAASLVTAFGNPKILAVGGYGGEYRANELYTP